MLLTKEKKEQLIKDYEAWWCHQLNRPIIAVTLTDTSDTNCPTRGDLLDLVYDFNTPVEKVIEAYKKVYNSNTYLGDGIPTFYLRVTGVLGGMLGEKYTVDNKSATIWFEKIDKDLKDLTFKLDKNDPLYQRGIEIYKAFQKEFKNEVALGAPDFGGVLDIYSCIRTSNEALMDLYDNPEEVIRINDELFAAYTEAHNEYTKLIDNGPKLGYSDWIPLLSQKHYDVTECDFICMIGPKQFNQFAYKYIYNQRQLYNRSFYHLDGPGAIKHLDEIIKMGYNGLQWVNGAGAKPLDDEAWTIIYQKVHDAHMLLQIFVYSKEELRFVDHLTKLFGNANDVAFVCDGKLEDKQAYLDYLDKYEVPR